MRRPAGIALSASAPAASRPRRAVAARALDTNLFANIFISGFCGAAAAGVTIVTSENRDKEIERIQTVDGALPIGAAIIGDAVLHSIPGFNVLFQLIGNGNTLVSLRFSDNRHACA